MEAVERESVGNGEKKCTACGEDGRRSGNVARQEDDERGDRIRVKCRPSGVRVLASTAWEPQSVMEVASTRWRNTADWMECHSHAQQPDESRRRRAAQDQVLGKRMYVCASSDALLQPLCICARKAAPCWPLGARPSIHRLSTDASCNITTLTVPPYVHNFALVATGRLLLRTNHEQRMRRWQDRTTIRSRCSVLKE